MKNLFLVVLALSVLSGCASSGNKTVAKVDEATVSAFMVKNKTTKQDVLNRFGSPQSRREYAFTPTEKHEVWHYEYTHAKANAASYIPIAGFFIGGANGQETVFEVEFKEDTVFTWAFAKRDFHYEHGQVYYGQ